MKCAVSDFDRTFSMDGAVSRENREAVRRWQQAGHWFVIATGRNEASLRKKLAEDPELGAVRPAGKDGRRTLYERVNPQGVKQP